MIDIDKLDEQLELALTGGVRVHRLARPAPASRPVSPAPPRVVKPAASTVPASPPSPRRPAKAAAPRPRRVAPPPPPPAARTPKRADSPFADADPALETQARRLHELLSLGQLDEFDAGMVVHRRLAEQKKAFQSLRDAAAWSAMRAILDGRQADARSAVQRVLSLGQQGGDPGSTERHLFLHYWVVSEWGDDIERYTLLDRCRERAYCYDELPWRAALTVLVARMGRFDEARREFDATVSRQDASQLSLDSGTHLAEAAWLLGDATRAETLTGVAANWTAPVVSVDRAWVCKGASARFRALLAAACGRWSQADAAFSEAVELHRSLGAAPLLARTLYERACTLSVRGDSQAGRLFDESGVISRRLHLTGLPARGPAAARAV